MAEPTQNAGGGMTQTQVVLPDDVRYMLFSTNPIYPDVPITCEVNFGRIPGIANPSAFFVDVHEGGVGFNPRVSARHARAQIIAGRVFFCDMGSSNGTFVNGTRLPREQGRFLSSGDFVSLAQNPMTTSTPAPANVPAVPSYCFRDRSAGSSEKQGIQKYYSILSDKPLGAGACGVVRPAVRHETGVEYAVKSVPKQLLNQIAVGGRSRADAMDRLLNEVRLLQSASHAFIVRVVEWFDEEDAIEIVMESVRGGDLFSIIDKANKAHALAARAVTENGSTPPPPQSPFPEAIAQSICWQLAAAVRYLHSDVHVTHRDLKPDNILVVDPEIGTSASAASRARSIDEGTKALHGPAHGHSPAHGHTATAASGPIVRNGVVELPGGLMAPLVKLADFGLAHDTTVMQTKCGTEAYMAPEVSHRSAYTNSCDVWSLGMVYCALLTGKMPPKLHPRESFKQLLLRSPAHASCFAHCSPACLDLLDGMLRYSPDDRLTAWEVVSHPWLAGQAFTMPRDTALEAALMPAAADATVAPIADSMSASLSMCFDAPVSQAHAPAVVGGPLSPPLGSPPQSQAPVGYAFVGGTFERDAGATATVGADRLAAALGEAVDHHAKRHQHHHGAMPPRGAHAAHGAIDAPPMGGLGRHDHRFDAFVTPSPSPEHLPIVGRDVSMHPAGETTSGSPRVVGITAPSPRPRSSTIAVAPATSVATTAAAAHVSSFPSSVPSAAHSAGAARTGGPTGSSRSGDLESPLSPAAALPEPLSASKSSAGCPSLPSGALRSMSSDAGAHGAAHPVGGPGGCGLPFTHPPSVTPSSVPLAHARMVSAAALHSHSAHAPPSAPSSQSGYHSAQSARSGHSAQRSSTPPRRARATALPRGVLPATPSVATAAPGIVPPSPSPSTAAAPSRTASGKGGRGPKAKAPSAASSHSENDSVSNTDQPASGVGAGAAAARGGGRGRAALARRQGAAGRAGRTAQPPQPVPHTVATKRGRAASSASSASEHEGTPVLEQLATTASRRGGGRRAVNGSGARGQGARGQGVPNAKRARVGR